MTLNVRLAAMPTTLDGLVTESFEQWTVVYNLADRLVEYGGKQELRTNLAKNYQISPDGREYTFELQENRFFHNGDPVTVGDVVYSLDLSLRNPHSYSRLKDQVDCTSGSKEEGCGAITVISPSVFKIRLRESSITFLDKLNMNENAIRSKKAHQLGHIVYSGPYKLSKNGEDQIDLSLNSRHPKADNRSFKSIAIRQHPDDLNRLQEMLGNQSQPVVMISKGFPTFISQDTPLSPDSSFQYASGNTFLLYLRENLPHLTQYKARIQNAVLTAGAMHSFPYLQPLASFYPTGYALGAPLITSIDTDTTKIARSIRIKYLASSLSPSLTHLLTQLLQKNGVAVTLVPVDAKTYQKPLNASAFDGIIASPYIDIQDEVSTSRSYFSGNWNYFPSPKPDLLKILDQADQLKNPDQRIAEMRRFYTKIFSEYPMIPLFFAPNMILLSPQIEQKSLEHFGNTIRLELFKHKGSE